MLFNMLRIALLVQLTLWVATIHSFYIWNYEDECEKKGSCSTKRRAVDGRSQPVERDPLYIWSYEEECKKLGTCSPDKRAADGTPQPVKRDPLYIWSYEEECKKLGTCSPERRAAEGRTRSVKHTARPAQGVTFDLHRRTSGVSVSSPSVPCSVTC